MARRPRHLHKLTKLAEQPAGLHDLTDDELRISLADRRAGLARVEEEWAQQQSPARLDGRRCRRRSRDRAKTHLSFHQRLSRLPRRRSRILTLCCHVDRGRDRATSLAAHAGVGPHWRPHVSDDDEDRERYWDEYDAYVPAILSNLESGGDVERLADRVSRPNADARYGPSRPTRS
jgi:hypothetical protein